MSKRVNILDGLRVIAIVMVILYHYYSRYYGIHYSYPINTKNVFHFGYLGVELFFIISGFVITLTLDKSKNMLDFLKKRIIRLWPAMFICSLLTFVFMLFFDHQFLFSGSHNFKNLLISNTFISPNLINWIFGTRFSYIDGAYWSLWVEISFYFIVSVLYFISKKNLMRNYGMFAIFFVIIHFLFISDSGKMFMISILTENQYSIIRKFVIIFNIMEMGLWFYIGMQLLEMFRYKKIRNLVLFSLFFLIQTLLLGFGKETLVFCFIVYIILIMFIYLPQYLRFLESPIMSKLGICSYSVYLIHENIGVFVINKLSPYLGGGNWVVGLVLLAVFFIFGVYCYKYWESPISKKIKFLLFK